MWQWIVQNKQWLFSGAGLTVLAALWWLKRWLLTRWRSPKPEPTAARTPAPTITQAPTINVNPTINVSTQQTSKPFDEKPLAMPAAPVSRPNLKIEAIKITKLFLQKDTWTLTPNPWDAKQSFKGLLADVANVPTASGSIKAVKVRASLTIGSRNYSPLPWLGQSTNAVNIEPAARKTILLAAGDDQVMGAWYFVLNHREYMSLPPRVPSVMDWTNLAPIPRHLMEILLVDVDSGELIATFRYLWTFDASLGYPYLRDVPEKLED